MKKQKIKCIIAVILGAVTMTCAVGTMVACMTTNDKKLTETANCLTSQSNGESVFISKFENYGITLSTNKIDVKNSSVDGASVQSETWYQICATTEPISSAVKLDWWLEFKNPNSTWAKDKNLRDYFSLTPPADGAMSATARVLQAFGEPILIKAKVRGNENVTATCQADYVKRFTVSEITLPILNNYKICDDKKIGNDVSIPLYSFSSENPNWRDPETSGLANVYCSGIGTIIPEIVSTQIAIKASDDFMNVYRSAPYYNVNGNLNECLYKDWYTLGRNGLIYADLIDEMSQPFAQNDNWCNAEDYEGFLSAISSYNSTDFYVRITATLNYSNKQVEEVSEYSCRFNRGSEVITVESLAFDYTNLIF